VESYDPGWSADVDGISAPIFVGNGFTLSVPVSAGKHEVRLVYRTPGWATGFGLSLLAAALLAGLIWMPPTLMVRAVPNLLFVQLSDPVLHWQFPHLSSGRNILDQRSCRHAEFPAKRISSSFNRQSLLASSQSAGLRFFLLTVPF
jgi:hypothetical protein